MIHEQGIYFGLPEKDYHADQSLSRSGICTLLQSPEEFWFQSWMNPDRPPEEEKDCLARGKLWHTRILEPHVFDDKYVKGIFESDLSGVNVLRTISDMKEHLGEDNYKSTWKKADYEEAIDGDPTAYLWDARIAQADALAKSQGKVCIWSEEVWNNMAYAEKMMNSYNLGIFENGMPEVSIFWKDTETGVPLKSRVDYLRPDIIGEYKTLYVQRGKNLRKAALDAIKWEKYDIQAAMATIAVAMGMNMINSKSGVIEGDVDGKFIDAIRQTSEKPFVFAFQQEEKPNAVRSLRVTRHGGDLFNVFGSGLMQMQQGIALYNQFWEKFGEKQWLDNSGITNIEEGEIYYG